MAERAFRRMTQDEFLEWHLEQEQRYELVDGVPVAMAGPKRRHDQVVVNAIIALGNQLGVGKCRPFSSDTAIRIPGGNIRYPDAGVDCGEFRDEATWAAAPRLVIEVLSASTRDFDLFTKLEEYKSVPTIQNIVFVNPDEPQLRHYARAHGHDWTYEAIDGLESTLSIPDLALSLELRALYAGLTFRPKPRPIYGEAEQV